MTPNIRCPLLERPIDRPSEYTCTCALSGIIANELEDLFAAQEDAVAYKRQSERQLKEESLLSPEEIQRLKDDDLDYEKLLGCTPGETSFFEYQMSLYGIDHVREKIQAVCTGKGPNIGNMSDAEGQRYLFDRFGDEA